MPRYLPNKNQVLKLTDFLLEMEYANHENVREFVDAIVETGGSGIFVADPMNYIRKNTDNSTYDFLRDTPAITTKFNLVMIKAGTQIPYNLHDPTYIVLDTVNTEQNTGGEYFNAILDIDSAITISDTPQGDEPHECIYLADDEGNLVRAYTTFKNNGIPSGLKDNIDTALSLLDEEQTRYDTLYGELSSFYVYGREGIYEGLENLTYSVAKTSDGYYQLSIMAAYGEVAFTNFNGYNMDGNYANTKNFILDAQNTLTVSIQNPDSYTEAYKHYAPIYIDEHNNLNIGGIHSLNLGNIDNSTLDTVSIGIECYRPEGDSNSSHIYIGALIYTGETPPPEEAKIFEFVPQTTAMNDYGVLNLTVPSYKVGTDTSTAFILPIVFPTLGPDGIGLPLPLDANANIISVKYIARILPDDLGKAERTSDSNEIINTDRFFISDALNRICGYTGAKDTVTTFNADGTNYENSGPNIAPLVLVRSSDKSQYILSYADTAFGATPISYHTKAYKKSGTTYYINYGRNGASRLTYDFNYHQFTSYNAYGYITISIIYAYTNNAILNDRWMWEIS